MLEARKRMSNGFFFSANATLARASTRATTSTRRSTTSGSPSSNRARRPTRRRSGSTANGSYDFNPMLSVSAIFRARTGFAYDPRTGTTFDLNGDGNFNDRMPGLERNSFRLPGNHSLDMRFTWTLPFGGIAVSLQATVEAFNLYNGDNVRTVQSQYGS